VPSQATFACPWRALVAPGYVLGLVFAPAKTASCVLASHDDRSAMNEANVT
jgi:hypothetical protein